MKYALAVFASAAICSTSLAKEPQHNLQNHTTSVVKKIVKISYDEELTEKQREVACAKIVGGTVCVVVGTTAATACDCPPDVGAIAGKATGEFVGEVVMVQFIDHCGTVRYNLFVRIPNKTKEIVSEIKHSQSYQAFLKTGEFAQTELREYFSFYIQK